MFSVISDLSTITNPKPCCFSLSTIAERKSVHHVDFVNFDHIHLLCNIFLLHFRMIIRLGGSPGQHLDVHLYRHVSLDHHIISKVCKTFIGSLSCFAILLGDLFTLMIFFCRDASWCTLRWAPTDFAAR